MLKKTVVVRPELCVGCMQCSIRCAEAHSASGVLAAAIGEPVSAKPRIHLGVGPELKPFPNKCRHCEPAPCQEACMPWAIRSDVSEGLKIVDPARCIGCGMCAMACPYYVIRFYPDRLAPEKPAVAVKCDGCYGRVEAGGIPACVEACKTGALSFEEVNLYLKEGTNRLARAVYGVQA
jgi:carbon-monoxide dehydrogenase iron sulfur subunit